MSLIITIVSFVLVLGILVFFHELGHYWVARRSGIVVEEFGMGYPPRALKLFRYDGTDFTLNWLPFGGFARMKGEDAADMAPGSFNAASLRGRALTLLAGPFMNLILAAILFTASFMVGGSELLIAYPQAVNTATEAAAAIGLLADDVLLQAGDAPTQVNALPDDAIQTTWESASTAPVPLTVLRSGETVTLPAVEASAVRNWLATPLNYVPIMTTRIEATAPGSPAEAAGLQSADLVYTANDTVITLDLPLGDIVQEHLGEQMALEVLRDDTLVATSLTPRVNPPAGEGSLGVQIGPVTQFAPMPFLQAARQGVVSTWQYITLVLELPLRLMEISTP